MRRIVATASALMTLALTGCGPSAEDVKELRSQQKQILAKLNDLERKLDQAPKPPPAARPQPDANKVYDLPVGQSAAKGPADAPAILTEFSDYQCPFCARSEGLVNDVLKAFPAQVRFVYKNFPLTSIHPHAMGASKAAVAAGRQGKYWEMHDKLFANQRELQPEKLKEYAKQVGLDVARWEKDMQSPEVQAIVDEEMKQAGEAQVQGTPTMFVNGKRVMSRSLDGIKAMVEEAIKAKSRG